ncbi:MAG TPA: hypothetical protein VEI26_03910 [Terriglobales bacterium]|nr:hypothetical protein [Terriglobales bacterium]
MTVKRRGRLRTKEETEMLTVRLKIPTVKRLQEISQSKDVPVAWIMRRAIEFVLNDAERIDGLWREER